MFTVDGISWSIPCDVTRVSEMTASEISGLMLDKSYFNDVLGTYMTYTVKIAVPLNMRDAYNRLYEAISAPVDGHTFILPYGSSTIQITGRVASISDVYVRLANGGVYWKGIEFEVVANAPSKTMSLSQVITRGRTPLPDIAMPNEGDSYTYTSGAWVVSPTYTDADNIAY